MHRSDVVQDRSEQIVAAAETVASWARARRAAWNTQADASSSEPLVEDAPVAREQTVSEMLTELVLNADFRKEID